MQDIERKKIQRFKVLQELYKQTNGDEHVFANINDICKKIGVPHSEYNALSKYLEGESLIEFRALGGIVSISHWGVKEIEEAHSNPDNPTEHFPAFNVVYVENMNNSQIQQGNVGSSQSMINNDNENIVQVLEKLLENIDNESCNQDKKDALKANVEILKGQVELPNEYRNKSIAKTAWNYISNCSALVSISSFLTEHGDKVISFLGF